MGYITFSINPEVSQRLPSGNYITIGNSEKGLIAPYMIYRASGAVTVRVFSNAIETVEFDYTLEMEHKLDIELELNENGDIVEVGCSVYKLPSDKLAAYQLGSQKLKGTSTNSSTSSNGGSSGGCYVATCVYGSYDCPQVWTLRRYRDNTLALSLFGRAFIRLYYAVSPAIVKWFGKTAWFKKLWRGKLDRIVERLQAKGVENTPYSDRNW